MNERSSGLLPMGSSLSVSAVLGVAPAPSLHVPNPIVTAAPIPTRLAPTISGFRLGLRRFTAAWSDDIQQCAQGAWGHCIAPLRRVGPIAPDLLNSALMTIRQPSPANDRGPQEAHDEAMAAFHVIANALLHSHPRQAVNVSRRMLANLLGFWVPVQLLAMGVPEGVVAAKYLDHTVPVRYRRFLAYDGVREAFARIATIGFSPFLQEVAAVYMEAQAVLYDAALPTAETAIDGARFYQAVIAQAESDAVHGASDIGLEMTFCPGPAEGGPYDTRDAVYTYIVNALEAQGLEPHAARSHYFDFPRRCDCSPTITETFMFRGHTIRVQRSAGFAAVVLRTSTARDVEVSIKTVRAAAVDAPEVEEEVVRCVQRALHHIGIVIDTTAELLALCQEEGGIVRHRSDILYIRDTAGDVAKLAVEFRDGDAFLTGLNATIGPAATRTIRLPGATSLAEVIRQLQTWIVIPRFFQKTDHIDGLWITDGPSIQLISETTHPLLQLKVDRVIPDFYRMLRITLQALGKRGYLGTTPSLPIGVTLPMSLPVELHGKISIAAALRLLGAYLQNEPFIEAIAPTSAGRFPVMRRVPPAYSRLLNDPQYVNDPTDPRQILCAMADYARYMPPRYVALDLDCFWSYVAQRLVEEGKILEGGFPVTRNGRSYYFHVSAHRAGPDPHHHMLDISCEMDGQTYHLLRVPRQERSPIARLRIFDTVHVQQGGRTAIDADAILWFLRFAAAFRHLHGQAV